MIVHVLGSMTAGGTERLCLDLMRRAPEGVEQALITINREPNGPLTELFRAVPGLQFFHEPYSRNRRARFVFRLARIVRGLRPRGIVVYAFGLHVLVSLASKAVPGCRFVVHAGNPPPSSGRRVNLFRQIVRASRWLHAPIWCCSEAVFRRFSDLGVALPLHSRAQPNGIDTAALRANAERGRATRTERGPILAMVARLEALKDHDTLLAAFARVLEQQPGVQLWIVGDGDRRKDLERQTAACALERSVKFLGVRQNIGELLGQVDVFVFSTTAAEGFGIALAEAMAVGLPVVASNVPACHEVLAGGACGDLVAPGDAVSLADAVLALLKDPLRARELGAAAAERARRVYDIGICAEEYYRYLLGNEGHAADGRPGAVS